MIDQLIRKHVQNYLNESKQLFEDTVNTAAIDTKSGWNFLIPSADSLRGQKAQRAAVANGAFTGLMIIATRRSYKVFGYTSPNKKTFNDAELENDVKKMFDAAARKDFPNKYDPKKTLFVYFKAVDKKYKKIWNVWAFDKQETGINTIVKQWKTELEKSTYFKETELKIDRIQSISLMSYNQAEDWFSSLEKAKQDFKLDTKINLPNLSAIKTADDSDDNTQKSKTVTVDTEGKVFDDKGQQIPVNAGGFSNGEAELRPSPDGESVILIPLIGNQTIVEHDTNRSGRFYGIFKDGAPASGTVTYDSAEGDQIVEFDGELSTKIFRKGDKQSFTFTKIKGQSKYANGFTFDGEFKDNIQWNGKLFNNQDQALGRFEQGEFKLGLKYPFEWSTSEYTFKVYNDGDKVYFNAIDSPEAWGEMSKDIFENKIYLTNSLKDSSIKHIDSWKDIVNLFIKFEGKLPDAATFKSLYIQIVKSPIDLYKKIGSEFKLEVREQPVNLSNATETEYSYKKQETSKGTIYYLIEIESEEFWIPEKFINVMMPNPPKE